VLTFYQWVGQPSIRAIVFSKKRVNATDSELKKPAITVNDDCVTGN
jgi:hypothetical protein